MKKVSFLSFLKSRNNIGNLTLWQRPLLKVNLLILETIFGAKGLLKRLLLTKQGSLLANNLESARKKFEVIGRSERGDVPGWVLVVLMTTGLVTGIWTVAQPRLSSILKNSLDNMNSIR